MSLWEESRWCVGRGIVKGLLCDVWSYMGGGLDERDGRRRRFQVDLPVFCRNYRFDALFDIERCNYVDVNDFNEKCSI